MKETRGFRRRLSVSGAFSGGVPRPRRLRSRRRHADQSELGHVLTAPSRRLPYGDEPATPPSSTRPRIHRFDQR